ncbi:MAG TPA: M61 family peptidase, partial [Anaeromyxobacteraceae bacterium]|nr:M61 family peptidase [Anaeromyxobacteraceae bacterium]
MRYRVTMEEPHSHLFGVEAVLDRPGPAPVLALPVWTPGSYLVREFARHLERIEADDGEGTRLPVTRLDKHRFRVDAGEAPRVRVRYRVYANDPTVRTSQLDGTHGYWNGANLFLYAEGRVDEPVELEVVPPPGWKV